MSELGERLHAIRAHLRTGALGQREVWEEWLTEAAAEVDRPRTGAPAMTLDEAYQRGQRDMRNRIEDMWSGYMTDSLGGHWKLDRPGKKGHSDVAVKIRMWCKVRALEPKP